MTQIESMIVCPECGGRVGSDRVACPICNAPIGVSGNLDPMAAIRGEGRALVRATEIKPKFIVVFGVWLIFLPMLIGSVALSFDVISTGTGSGASGFIFFWGGVGLSILSAAFLFKVTKNYLTEG